MKNQVQRLWLAGTACLLMLAACGEKREERSERNEAAEHGQPSGEIKPDDGGKVIEVELFSDEKGNYFKPAEITAKKGDVIKYELKTGVHNVNFLADSNPGARGLPRGPSDMLQLPDQEYRVKVTWDAGKYYFQCDPHALLGMKGHITVK